MSAHRYTLRVEGPLMIQRGAYTTARCAIYDGAAPMTFSGGGTWELVDGGGTVVTSGSVSTDGNDTTATIAAADTSGQAYSTKWRLRLSMMEQAIPEIRVAFERDVWLVRSVLLPTVTVDDLVRRHRDLRDLVDGGDDAINGYGIEAWAGISADLIKRGKRPNLIMESWALRSLLMFRWLMLVFEDAASRFSGEDRYAKLVERYQALADEEWSKNIIFEYDSDEDGHGDGAAAGSNVLVLSAGPMGGPRRWAGWR